MIAQDHHIVKRILGGSGEIRTHGTIAGTSDFKSGAINRALPHFQKLIYTLFMSSYFNDAMTQSFTNELLTISSTVNSILV